MCDTFFFFFWLCSKIQQEKKDPSLGISMSAPTPTLQGYSSSVTSTLRLYDLILKQPADSHLIQQATYYCLL